MTPLEILQSGDKEKIKALFKFNINESDDIILMRFGLWARYFFPKYFKRPDASFHKDIDLNNLYLYKGTLKSFTNIAFRGGAKTARTKLFLAFAILNDLNHRHNYIKILTKDVANSKQTVTDIYNMFVDPKIRIFYPNTFLKTDQKHEESMETFTTSFGVKVRCGTVGTDQRGALQTYERPSYVWFDDFETKKTLRSAVETKAIWDNMEEAKNGLSEVGACVYTCNYFSERGNVHKLVCKQNKYNKVLITPIKDKNNVPTWYHTIDEIDQIEQSTDDFAGEFMCQPSAGKDIFFDRETIDKMEARQPVKEISGFKMFYKYDASHRYAGGMDVAGGVGLDSSTAVYIDFDSVPARVVATYANNEIRPESFGDEIAKQAEHYGECLVAPEKNNHGHATIARLKQIYPVRKIYKTQKKLTSVKRDSELTPTEYGWQTTYDSKDRMMQGLAKAIESGWLELSDPALIAEARGYSRNDLMDGEEDARLSTRHFDLLTACAIAWQMKTHADMPTEKKERIMKFQRQLDNENYDPFSLYG